MHLNSLLVWGIRLWPESLNKRKIQFSISKVSASAYESVRLRECVNTEFDWVVKRGFVKASVSRAILIRECPSAEN